MLDQKKVFVAAEGEEVTISTANLMGPDNAISQKELKELQERVKALLLENDGLKTEWATKEATLKALVDKARDEKAQLEKRLYETEFLVGEGTRQLEQLKQQHI